MREMRESGVGYLGEIPVHWDTERIKNHLRFSPDKNPGDAMILSLYREHGIVPKDSRDDNHNVTSEDTSNYRYVRVGDFVVNKMKAWQGSMGVSDYEGAVSPAYYVYRFTTDAFDKKYLHYLLRSKCYADEFRRLSGGIRIGQWDLPKVGFETTYVAVPPKAEQTAIAEAIYVQLNKVDTLITNVQTQIEKLKAYKQSLITEVVTKGLDPTVPMKDSGVEWIGEIADTYTIFRLKYLLDSPMQYGANETGDKYTEDSVRYIRITDISADGKLKDDENNQYLPLAAADNYILKDKDVLFARSGGTVGKSFLYREEYGTSAFAGYLIKAECDQSALLPEYLIYYTQSSLYELWKNMIFIQATIQNIGANKYSNMEVPVPSIEEQSTIVEYLGGKCSQIDRLISIKQSKIEKLEQYKRSLIYEYVTGKKEVP